MTQFDDRERAFETKFAHDEEMKFRITARRNRLLGQWAARQMGLTEAEAESYAKDVVRSDFEEAGDHDVIRKVLGDLTAAGVDCDEDTGSRGAAQQGDRGAAPDHRGDEHLMPMAASEIEGLIRAAIPDAEVTIRDLAGDGDHYAARVVSRELRGHEPDQAAPGRLCRAWRAGGGRASRTAARDRGAETENDQ